MKVIALLLLICTLFAFATASWSQSSESESSFIQLDVYSGSNAWWLALAVRNAGVDTRSVQIKEAGSSSWEYLEYSRGWGYFIYSSRNRLSFPVSVLLVSVDGDQVTLNDIITSSSVSLVDTGVSYTNSSSEATAAPTSEATASPTGEAPTGGAPTDGAPTDEAPTGEAPTSEATGAPSEAPTSEATGAPTSEATGAPSEATSAPTKPSATTKATTASTAKPSATTKPTSAATTKPSATTKPTTKPSSGSSGMKLLVPLYEYPDSNWDIVAANAATVTTVAIINPSNGPSTGPDSAFTSYMTKLHTAGVTMIGYVHTTYGARAVSDVKADINIYATEFPLLAGIFIDECSADESEIAYYQELYEYIMSFPGWTYDILNPGAVPASGYAAVSTTIVTFEDVVSSFASSSNPSWATSSNRDTFAVISYSCSSASAMESAVAAAASKGYYGWVYFNSGTNYNTIPSYYAAMASYVASYN